MAYSKKTRTEQKDWNKLTHKKHKNLVITSAKKVMLQMMFT